MQVRAARGMLNWSVKELAERSGISFSVIPYRGVQRDTIDASRIKGSPPGHAFEGGYRIFVLSSGQAGSPDAIACPRPEVWVELTCHVFMDTTIRSKLVSYRRCYDCRLPQRFTATEGWRPKGEILEKLVYDRLQLKVAMRRKRTLR